MSIHRVTFTDGFEALVYNAETRDEVVDLAIDAAERDHGYSEAIHAIAKVAA